MKQKPKMFLVITKPKVLNQNPVVLNKRQGLLNLKTIVLKIKITK